MNEKSQTCNDTYNKVRLLVRNLRKRYPKKGDLYIGLLSLLAGEKLIKGYYQTHKNLPKLLDWQNLLINNTKEFQEEIKAYKIKV